MSISSCNIMKNEQKNQNDDDIIYSNGKITVKDSCVLDNIAKLDFYSASSSCSIEVTNCMPDPNVDSRKNSYVTITNTKQNSYSIGLAHIATGNCKAIKDLRKRDHSNNIYFIKKRNEKIARMIILLLMVIGIFAKRA